MSEILHQYEHENENKISPDQIPVPYCHVDENGVVSGNELFYKFFGNLDSVPPDGETTLNGKHYLVTSRTNFNEDGSLLRCTIFTDNAPVKILERKIEESYIDDLTGAYNRKFLNFILNKLEKENITDLTVAFLDLNNFKKINDDDGHFAGNEILKKAFILLKDSVREEDRICRVGGDEYAILFSKVISQDDMLKIKKRIEELDFGKNDVSFAIGFASTSDPDISTIILTEKNQAELSGIPALFARTIAKADQEMYRHKIKIKEQLRNEPEYFI